MIIVKIILLVLILILLPLMAGILPVHFLKKQERSISKAIILGYIASLALLEVIGIPITLFISYSGFYILMGIYLAGLLFVSFLGVHIMLIDIKRFNRQEDEPKSKKELFKAFISGIMGSVKGWSTEAKIYCVLIVILVVFQVIMSLRMASYDVDDAYYNAYAKTAQQYGTLYRADPNTGKSIPVDMRHAMALFPIFQAIFSTLSGVHLLIVAHKVMPIIIIPLVSLLIYEIGRQLFPKSDEQVMIFTLLVSVFRLFGCVSEYTVEMFLFTRTWQGKALAGNFIFPAIIWIFLYMMNDQENKGGKSYFAILGLMILASGAGSSLAVMLSMLLTMILGVLFAIKDKRIALIYKSLIACIPGMLYVLIYILM